jgi:hypothetical protein
MKSPPLGQHECVPKLFTHYHYAHVPRVQDINVFTLYEVLKVHKFMKNLRVQTFENKVSKSSRS